MLHGSKTNLTRKALISIGAWFFFLNSVFAAIISVRYLGGVGSIDISTFCYLVITVISHFAMLVFIPYLLLYLPVAIIFPKRKFLVIVAAFITTFILTILFLDSFVFSIYRFHIYNGFILEMLSGPGASDIFEFKVSQYLLCAFSFAIVFVAEFFLFRLIENLYQKRKLKAGKYVIIILALFLLISNIIHAYAVAKGNRKITKTSLFYPLHFPLRANSFFQKIGILAEDDNLFIDSNNSENFLLDYPKSSIVLPDSLVMKNMLVILIDSWNYRTMTEDSVTMPTINSFAKKSSSFTHHYTGSNGTRTGVFSLFYSIPGTYFDAVNYAPGTTPVLMDALAKYDFEMGVYASANLSNPPFNRIIFSKVKNLQIETSGETAPDRDKEITKRWLNFIDKYDNGDKKKPFFGFLFYDALHNMTLPKDAEEIFPSSWKYAKYESLNNELDPTPFFNLYKNCAHWIDKQVEIVLDDLQRKGLLDNTVVIITGDHGQEFNENKKNYWGHGANYTKYQMQIPFILYDKDLVPTTYTHWTSHYDVAPTLMQNYFHCTNPVNDYSSGKNLFDTAERDWLLVGSLDNFGIVQKDKITVINFDRSYDIYDNNYDPLDTKLDAQIMNQALFEAKRFFK